MSKVTIEGWIARDRNGLLYMYTEKPERDVFGGYWFAAHGVDRLVGENYFPEVTWETEPKPCKITIEI